MPIAFDRSICRDFQETISREWIITNGQGGYAAGTVSGALTRMQHGLLVAPLPGTSTPHLLLAKIDEEVVFDQRTYYLGTNEYQDGTLNPSGFVHLETFHLQEGYPLFTYRLGGIDGILLEKRIWMASDSQTTFIQYRVLRRTDLAAAADTHKTAGRESAHKAFGRHSSYAEQRALTLTLLPFSAYRPFDQPQQGSLDCHFQVSYGPDALPGKSSLPAGVAACSIRAWKDAPPYTICAVGHEDSAATFIPTNVWYWHFLRRHDQAAGKAAIDDLYLPGVIRAKLWPGEDATLTIIVSAEELSSTTQLPRPGQGNLSFTRSVEERRDILQPQRYYGEGGITCDNGHLETLPAGSLNAADPSIGEEEFLRLLIQAADRFLIQGSIASRDATSPGRGSFFLRPSEHVPGVRADYYGLSECTRDTLIALPGLMLSTQRPEIARSVLRNLARHFRQGLLPDHPPVQGPALQEEEEDYDGADTTLWFFYALDHYLCTTGDYELLDELYPRLSASVDWHLRGTFNTIAVDSCDGLLKANCPGKALTWMNATFKGTPITPRGGKAVEVNALWYHTLSLMQEWSHYRQAQGQATQAPAYYAELSQRCKESFNLRFWHAPADYLFDGVDGAQGEDAALRPNQLLAVALRHQVLDKEYWREVFDATTRHLLTPFGLRTLAAHETAYQGRPGAHQEEQLRALHQGGSWPWLIGPYVDAMMNIERAFSTSGPVRSSKNTPEHWWNRCLELLKPFLAQFSIGILGMIGGVYDGDSPHHLSSRLTSVMGAGEFLRLHNLLAHNTFRPAEEALLAAHSGSHGRSSHPGSRPWEAEKRSF